MKKEAFLEEIEKAREDFRKARQLFHNILPKPWVEFLKCCSAQLPEEEFQKLVEKSKIGFAEAREETIKIWNENLECIFSLIQKQFQQSIEPNEMEIRVLALVDLLKDAAIFVTEELKAIDIMQDGLDKVTKKQ